VIWKLPAGIQLCKQETERRKKNTWMPPKYKNVEGGKFNASKSEAMAMLKLKAKKKKKKEKKLG
jgi:hypothetical protein